jgi:hypothetical protein
MNMRSRSTKRQAPGIRIDIPNVSPKMKLSDLTVDQFVKLLVQVNEELRASSRKLNRETIGPVMRVIRKHLSESAGTSGVNNAVRQTQLAILEKMPDFLKKAQR